MGRLKKNKSGPSLGFLPREVALKRLQLSLPDFRKICILKGIYPRNPTKKLYGSDKTYYYLKDLRHIQRDPLIAKFREERIWHRRITRLKTKKKDERLQYHLKRRPTYQLTHLVKERYPTFMDALHDLDDCLTMISLFSTVSHDILDAQRVKDCRNLLFQFEYYVICTHALKKAFISIKGYYFQASVLGVPITWIVPHSLLTEPDQDVDYTIMLTFLEFYQILLGFVNYKLFQLMGKKYPPLISQSLLNNGHFFQAIETVPLEITADKIHEKNTSNKLKEDLKEKTAQKDRNLRERIRSLPDILDTIVRDSKNTESIECMEAIGVDSVYNTKQENEVKKKGTTIGSSKVSDSSQIEQVIDSSSSNMNVDQDKTIQSEQVDEDSSNLKTLEKMDQVDDFPSPFLGQDQIEDELLSSAPKPSLLFSGYVFFISREVPRQNIEFIILSFGGQVTWDGGDIPEDSLKITHQIVDRSIQPKNPVLNRNYLQPQWIFDSINVNKCLCMTDYQPTRILPPHYSPFQSIPQEDTSSNADGHKVKHQDSSQLDNYSSDEEQERIFTNELEAERAGIESNSLSQVSDSKEKKLIKLKQIKQEDIDLSRSIMSSRKRYSALDRDRKKATKMALKKSIEEKRRKISSKELILKDSLLVPNPEMIQK